MKYTLIILFAALLMACTPHQNESPSEISQAISCEDSTFLIFRQGDEVKMSETVPFAAIGNDNYKSVLATIGPQELNLFGEPWVNDTLSRRLPVIGYMFQCPTIYVVFDPDLRASIYAQHDEPSQYTLKKKEVVRVQQVGTCLVVMRYVDNNTINTWKPIDPF